MLFHVRWSAKGLTPVRHLFDVDDDDDDDDDDDGDDDDKNILK